MAGVPLALTVLTLTAGLLALVMAFVVWRAGPRVAVNRLLGGVLALEGVLQLTFVLPTGDEGLGAFFEPLFFVPILILPWLYLLFLGRLDTPLARPLRRARRIILYAVWLFSAAAISGWLTFGIFRVEPVWVIPFVPAGFLVFGAASVYGLVVAVSAWRRAAPGGLARQRAGAYALAFGARDSLVALGVIAFVVEEMIAPNEGIHIPAAFLVGLSTLLFIPFLAYGILRTRLLGIEARLRWTISRGTVVAMFVAAYVVGSQAAALLVAPRFGPTVGVVAAGLLVLGLMPLQRMAERLAAAAVPTPDQGALDDQRLEAYRLAMEDLGPSDDPRAQEILTLLRARLGITDRDHAIVSHFVRSGSQPDAASELRPGERFLGRFRVLEMLGEGGHARAFLVEDDQLSRKVVLKVFHPDRTPDAVLREARAVAALRHPNVVTVYDVVVMGDRVFLVLEHVEGGSLQERLKIGRLTMKQFTRLALDLSAALVAVERAGLVHRDVKPANVLLTKEGYAKLADFGVAMLSGADRTRVDVVVPSDAVGTVAYMSPEQAKGHTVTAAGDQYALALTLYEALTGARYLIAAAVEDVHDLQRRAARPPPFKGIQGAPPALESWFRRALAPRAADRFPDAHATRAALIDALAPHQAS